MRFYLSIEWQEWACTEAWQELGDEFRSNRARNYADGDPVTRRALVADQVRMVLELDQE